jgi:hypothetical protein
MRILRHWKMILGLAALYGAGCFTGGAGLLILAFTHPSPETMNRWVAHRFTEYENRLKLTPEQKSKIKPIAENARDQIRVVGRTAVEQAIPILEDAQKKIGPELTPQQREVFERMNRETRKRLQDFAHQASVPAPASVKSDGPSAAPAAVAPESR